MSNAEASSRHDVWTDDQANFYLRKQWEKVAGKDKHNLQYRGVDGKPMDGFAIVILGSEYRDEPGCEVLICDERVVSAGIALDLSSAKSWGESLYRSHYGI